MICFRRFLFILLFSIPPAVARPTASAARKIAYPSWEVRTAPIALLARWLTLDVAYRFSEHFATGPAIVLYEAPIQAGGNMLMPTYRGSAWGWQANYYFKPITERSNGYVGGRIYSETYKSYPHDMSEGGYDDVSGTRADVFIGALLRSSPFIFMGGVGFEFFDHKFAEHRTLLGVDQPVTHDSESDTRLMLEFKAGIEF